MGVGGLGGAIVGPYVKIVYALLFENKLEEPFSNFYWINLKLFQEYTEKLVEYVTTMVCVAIKGVPVMGIIYKPFQDITAWGWSGPNLISNALKSQIEDSSRVGLDQARLIVSRSHAGGIHDVAAKQFGPDVKV